MGGHAVSASSEHDLAVVIPARNEASTIADVVRHVRELGFHVIVVDDASSDRTSAKAQAAGADTIALSRWVGNMRAIQAGMRKALRTGYTRVITLDADGQHDPADIPRLLEAGVEPDEVIIGSCPSRASPLRHIAWRLFRLISGLRVEDMTTGFKLYGNTAVQGLLEPKARLLWYQDVPALLYLRRKGISFREVPVTMYPRRSGISHVFASWNLVARYMAYTTCLCCLYRLRIWPW